MDVHEKFQNITTMIFDVDGVFTDGTLIVTENGDLLRSVNARDGYALKRALAKGFRIIILTGGDSVGVEKRFRKLGVEHIYMSVSDKLSKYKTIMAEYSISNDEVLYVGDDILDIELLKYVFLPACPRDACHEVLALAEFISNFDGGKGAVREIIEKVMSSQNKWYV